MKTNFGRLSILCFIVPIIGFVILRVCVFHSMHNATGGVILLMMTLGLSMVFVPLGLVFCLISAKRKETPKCYRYIGLPLNFLWILLFVYLEFLAR